MKIFAERLKELRKEKNISLMALGKAIGVTNTTICNWENEIHDIKGEQLAALAKYFGVTAGYLLGIED